MDNNNAADKKPSLSWSAPAATLASKAAGTQKDTPSLSTSVPSVGRYVGIFSAGLVVGVLLFWAYTMATTHVPATATATQGSKTTTVAGQNSGAAAGVTIGQDGMAQANAALEIASPQKAGLSVAVGKVSLTEPTWVVVYESVAGKPGNVFGAHLFFNTGPGMVTLLRATTAGKEYFVGTSVDNGDRKYSKAGDKPTAFTDGTPEVARFTAN